MRKVLFRVRNITAYNMRYSIAYVTSHTTVISLLPDDRNASIDCNEIIKRNSKISNSADELRDSSIYKDFYVFIFLFLVDERRESSSFAEG